MNKTTRSACSPATRRTSPLCVLVLLTFSALVTVRGQQASNSISGSTDHHWAASSWPELLDLLRHDDLSAVTLDSAGDPTCVCIAGGYVDDENIKLLTQIGSIRELIIQRAPHEGKLTEGAIACCRNLTNLVTLQLRCGGLLDKDVFRRACEIESLRVLSLANAYPPENEYAYLTNLHALVELRLTLCTNFGDAEVPLLRALPDLSSIELKYCSISRQGTNILGELKRLTNAVVILRGR